VTGWHKHEAPVLGYMLDGEISVDYGPDGTRVYRAGDAFLEAFQSEHDGTNTGTEPARILMVVMGADGVPLSTPRAE
jgi:quercetin dioxygenase-like cupin family protein